MNDLILPITLQLEITNSCNMNCGFCYNNSGKPRPGDLSMKEWVEFSSSVVDFGGVFQCIISGGEPTLYKKGVIDIMEVFHYDDSAFTLISNGTGIDSHFASLLSKYKWFWVQISLDSHLSEKHDHIRGFPGAWKQAVRAIGYLKKNKVPTTVASVIYKYLIKIKKKKKK